MEKKHKNVSETVRELIEETVNSLGYEIWDVEYAKEGASWYLTVTIDHENGIDLDAVEEVHNAIDPILDEHDPIDGFYYLSVSSPGIERNIRTKEHFEATIGEMVTLKLFAQVNGKKEYTGELMGISDDGSVVTISDGENNIEIERKKISKANVCYIEE